MIMSYSRTKMVGKEAEQRNHEKLRVANWFKYAKTKIPPDKDHIIQKVIIQ